MDTPHNTKNEEDEDHPIIDIYDEVPINNDEVTIVDDNNDSQADTIIISDSDSIIINDSDSQSDVSHNSDNDSDCLIIDVDPEEVSFQNQI